jgi:hypothetical protein
LPQLGEEPLLLRDVLRKRTRCPGGAGLELVREPHRVPGIEVGVAPPGLGREADGDGGDDRRQEYNGPDQEPCHAWKEHDALGQ